MSDDAPIHDEHALLRAKGGDIEAFSTLVRAWHAHLRAHLALLGVLPDRLDEAVEDGFVAAYRNLPRFDQKRPFAAWLNQTALEAVERPRPGREGLLSPGATATFLRHQVTGNPVLAPTLPGSRLRAGLEALPEADRSLILRRHQDGLSAEALAGDPAGAGKVRRALVRLRRSLHHLAMGGGAAVPIEHHDEVIERHLEHSLDAAADRALAGAMAEDPSLVGDLELQVRTHSALSALLRPECGFEACARRVQERLEGRNRSSGIQAVRRGASDRRPQRSGSGPRRHPPPATAPVPSPDRDHRSSLAPLLAISLLLGAAAFGAWWFLRSPGRPVSQEAPSTPSGPATTAPALAVPPPPPTPPPARPLIAGTEEPTTWHLRGTTAKITTSLVQQDGTSALRVEHQLGGKEWATVGRHFSPPLDLSTANGLACRIKASKASPLMVEVPIPGANAYWGFQIKAGTQWNVHACPFAEFKLQHPPKDAAKYRFDPASIGEIRFSVAGKGTVLISKVTALP